MVVELCDIDNKTHVQLIGGEHVEVVCSHDILGRVMVLSAVNRGLGSVYAQLLGFHGMEFYSAEFTQFVGKAFGDVVFQFNNAVLCGIINQAGFAVMNPTDETLIRDGDRLLVLAEDDSTFAPSEQSFRPLDIAAAPSEGF